MSIITMKSQALVKQKEFEWKWRIENFNMQQKFTQKFSLDDGRLVLQVECIPKTKKSFNSCIQWRFLKISQLWSEKIFNLSVCSDPEPTFVCDNGCFEDMLLNQKFYGRAFPLLKRSIFRSCMDQSNALTLKFEMTLRDADKVKANGNKMELNDELLLQENKKMLFSKQFTDFEFDVSGEKIQAHKALLAARSDVFGDILRSDDKEKEKEIATITDVNIDVFKKFLVYVYSEKVPDNSIPYVADFLFLAEKYDIPDLTEKCEEILQEQMNDSTSILAFKLAHRYKLDEDLLYDSFKFIQKKFAKLNQKLSENIMDQPEDVINLCNDYQKLLDGLKKHVKFADDAAIV